ncbi:uncharacterized protein N7483_011652 [Penicillium malachiteum]|uniref:uncharacterized protein n=1 Tax=Penicillium malachiteum TaxID=1324776 RepID=UPI002548C891|nr:uncharacterized protein N7483_011652 [Penicillium malachiteum]KAJ5714471.1 hypothetical protein N7483_011652 [Penicillium malachiteum]
MSTDSASAQTQEGASSNSVSENSFSFTPIKALRAIPRLWERKPTTSFRAGPKSRKLWKRVCTSFAGMQSLETSTVLENDAFQTAINASRDASYVRGVKRRCVGDDQNERPVFKMHQPNRSVIETKWEADTSRHRRKMPDGPLDIFDQNLQNGQHDLTMTGSPQPLSLQQSPFKTKVFNEEMSFESLLRASTGNADNSVMAPTPTKVARDSTHKKKGTLMRSALRSSMDGSDTELLNGFVSRAQAKRDAKAAMINKQETTTGSASSSDASEVEHSTPKPRRALEARNGNSPSPIKIVISPKKMNQFRENESQENSPSKEVMDEEEVAAASPTCRRSTRVKAPQVALPAPNAIALRRAKGNEFIFLTRTDVQKLALLTKKNTRLNRGDAVLPKFVLESMADEWNDEASDVPAFQPKRRSHAKKSVSWNNERLVEFEDERSVSEEPVEVRDSCKEHIGGAVSSESAAKQLEEIGSGQHVKFEESSHAESENVARATSGSVPTTRSQHLRRLGVSTIVTAAPMQTGSGQINNQPALSIPTTVGTTPTTPTKPRRKLIPKSPSLSTVTTVPFKNNDQSHASGIPTRSASIGGSERPKRRSAVNSSAGCTPMPRRIRNRD